jgi:3'-phosphoadenosine 5'-phosphosulfate sulfotransferase (PAPS reductase)/FAD synthetase
MGQQLNIFLSDTTPVEPELSPLEVSPQIDIHSYDKYIVTFSGGKDSTAMFLHLLDLGVDRSKIELWHHEIDGREDTTNFMDFPVTTSYCQAFADAFGVPIFFSWKQGGFKGEMLRENSRTAPTHFEDENKNILTAGGEGGKVSTRRRYPQTSGDLSVRWCSASLKIDVCSIAICNQKRFNNSRTLVLSGERGEESPARAKYQTFEVDRADNRFKTPYEVVTKMVSSKGKSYEVKRLVEPGKDDRHVDRWRPIKDWSEKQVWEIIERYKIRTHPAYEIGFSRVSCLFCIFGNQDQFFSAYQISPQQGDEIIKYEKEFGCTIKRNESVSDLIARGKPYPGLSNTELVQVARSKHYTLPIFCDPWVLPAGAFGKGCGPV